MRTLVGMSYILKIAYDIQPLPSSYPINGTINLIRWKKRECRTSIRNRGVGKYRLERNVENVPGNRSINFCVVFLSPIKNKRRTLIPPSNLKRIIQPCSSETRQIQATAKCTLQAVTLHASRKQKTIYRNLPISVIFPKITAWTFTF